MIEMKDVNGVYGLPVSWNGKDYMVQRGDGMQRTVVYTRVANSTGWHWRPIQDTGPAYYSVLRVLKKLEEQP